MPSIILSVEYTLAALSNVLDDSFDLEAVDIAFENETENIDSPCCEESILSKKSAKEELNAVFWLLNMEKRHDDRRFKKIRDQINSVYRHLKHLCDVLEDNDGNEAQNLNQNPIRTDESNELYLV
ncbi:unnamed protein product [Rotaria socialis]|uniref:Uncharacterized protein n=1 Tax=Rotaria socialis TaxID=392032 RepID=A0A820XQS3_9BILA|nr:unnamed protein product [Rotaria socialis]CAF4537048.1 unnamed protein product [Rotaria socialis]